MKHDVNTLPDDMEALKQIVIEQGKIIQAKDLEYQLLEEKYKTLQRMFFGKRSESSPRKMNFSVCFLMSRRMERLQKVKFSQKMITAMSRL